MMVVQLVMLLGLEKLSVSWMVFCLLVVGELEECFCVEDVCVKLFVLMVKGYDMVVKINVWGICQVVEVLDYLDEMQQ